MEPPELARVTRLEELSHVVGGSREQHASALSRDLDAERDGEVCLAGADGPGEDHVFGACDPLSACELGDLRGIDGTVGRGEVEGVERLELWKARIAGALAHGGLAP